MASYVFMLIIGLALLLKGADFLVAGASSIAKKFNVSDLFIGFTIVSFGTSAPELIVSVMSSVQGHADFTFGNVLGSNSFNILLVLGVAGIISPLVVQRTTVKYEIPMLVFITLLLLVLVRDNLWGLPVNQLSRLDAAILLIFFSGFIGYVYFNRKTDEEDVSSMRRYSNPLLAIGAVIVGLGMLFFGGKLAVAKATDIARSYHISERIIGLTILAIGTSLPELVTSLVAVYKKRAGIAIGNVIGSNIFNICVVLGLTGLITPIRYHSKLNIDLYVATVSAIMLLLFMFFFKKNKLNRGEAFFLLISYISYITFLVYSEVKC